MKKLLLSIIAAVFAIGMNAQTVIEFDATQDLGSITDYNNAGEDQMIKDGVTISITNGCLGLGTDYRTYKNASMTLSSVAGDIINIEFTCTANGTTKQGPGCWTANCGSYAYEGKVGTWSGEASEVVFTASANQVRATKIVVTIGAANTNPTISAKRAIDFGTCKSGATATLTVAGVNLTEAITAMWEEDTDDFKFEGALTAEGGELTITLLATAAGTYTANLQLSSGNAFAEVAVSAKIIGELPGTGEGTVESPYDVARAIAVCEATGTTATSEVYYVKGIVSRLDTKYANTFWMSDNGAEENELEFYNGKGLNGATIASGDINVGDEIVAYGKLVNYKDNTPELNAGCQIYSINGQTAAGTEPEQPEEPYVAVGDGSEANPYTVADIIGLNIEKSDNNKYWVKGYILGTVDNGKLVTTPEKYANTNLALGATADAETFVPVQLPDNDIRSSVNLIDNPELVGKEVMVYGTLEKYFSMAGVKNVTNAKIDGVPVGISTVKAAGETGVVYDLNGRRVSEMSRGLYIIDGKKVIK